MLYYVIVVDMCRLFHVCSLDDHQPMMILTLLNWHLIGVIDIRCCVLISKCWMQVMYSHM